MATASLRRQNDEHSGLAETYTCRSIGPMFVILGKLLQCDRHIRIIQNTKCIDPLLRLHVSLQVPVIDIFTGILPEAM